MVQRFRFDEHGNTIDLGRIDHLWIAKTEWRGWNKLIEKGYSKIPTITSYLWERKEDAIRWAHHCLREIKGEVEERHIRDDRIEYILHGEIIASVETTGLICDQCHDEDW